MSTAWIHSWLLFWKDSLLAVVLERHSCLYASPPLGVKSSYRALTRYPGLQVLISDCVGLRVRRNGLLRVKLKRARRVASGLAVMPAGTPVGFYFRCVGWLSAFMRIPDARCLIRFKSYVHLFLRLRAFCLCLVGLQIRRNGISPQLPYG